MNLKLVIAIAVPLIIAGCGSSTGGSVDQRSYDAGYSSMGPGLVARGMSATKACEDALLSDYSFEPSTFQRYDTMSFNSGCYTAIRDHGLSVKNDSGGPVPDFS